MLNYEEEISLLRIKEFEVLRNTLSQANSFEELDKDLQAKIRNHIGRFAYAFSDEVDTGSDLGETFKHITQQIFSEEALFQQLKFNPFLQSFFIKDPVKQSAHQTLAWNYLRKSLPSADIEMPSNKKYFLSGYGVLTKSELNNIQGKTKSIDFVIETANATFICTHKYTKTSGGGQDNQYKDVQSFLAEGPNQSFTYRNKPCYIVAILDGEYYEQKITALQERFSSKWYLIGNIEQIIASIKTLTTETLLEKIEKTDSIMLSQQSFSSSDPLKLQRGTVFFKGNVSRANAIEKAKNLFVKQFGLH